MAPFAELDAFILAGGQSSRMGRDKALLEIGGKALLQRAGELLGPLAASVTVVGGEARYSEFGLHVLADRWSEAGPLGGIATALSAAERPWALVLACDMPFVTGEFLSWLSDRAISDTQNSLDALVPTTSGGLEPLCALYRCSSAAILNDRVARGVRKVSEGLRALRVELVPESTWRAFSPDGLLFRNLNTWQDYLEARAVLEAR